MNQTVLNQIFNERHLDEITLKGTLHYSFQGYDKQGEPFKDKLSMIITDINDKNLKSIEFDIFSGKRKRTFPKLTHRFQNPVIVLFFQRDADNMAKIFGIQSQYIRKLIKEGFRSNLSAKKIRLVFNNKTLDCLQASMKPFLSEDKTIYKEFTGKVYEVTICPEIPGKIYEIKTDVQNEKGASLFIERLKFDHFAKAK